jgi:predicted transcriptional regulator
MSNGGKRLRELIRKRGFRLGAVADAIGVSYETMRTWSNTAPIDKLIKISEFCDIDIIEIINCFRSDLHPQASDPIEDN